jgi:FMN phosphatase YigB (HAD superfamily)
MSKLSVVSIDMFCTLADVGDLLKYERWQKLFKENYAIELAQECQTHLDNSWTKHFPRDGFMLQKQILHLCFTDLLSRIPFEFSPSEATALTVEQHSLSKPFDDSIAFLSKVGKEYRICLASDADEDLLGALRNMYAFDRVFTSEQLRTYKGWANGRFFSTIINHYGVRPEQIIHIGDDPPEIVGASKVGIITCWLNRNARIWADSVKPDYEVKSLIEAAALLGIEI